MSAYGVSPVLAIVTPYGLSAETVCEIKVFIGKPLRPGWTLKAVHLEPGRYPWPVSALAGSACEVHSAAFGTNSPTVSIFVKHPGSINPSSSVATHCKVHDMVFYGPADPDMPTGLFDILSPP